MPARDYSLISLPVTYHQFNIGNHDLRGGSDEFARQNNVSWVPSEFPASSIATSLFSHSCLEGNAARIVRG